MYKWLNILNWLLFMVLITFSLSCVITMPGSANQIFSGYKEFLFPNCVLAVPAAVLAFLSYRLVRNRRVETWLAENSKWLIFALLALYGLSLTVYIMLTMFNGKWDPMIVQNTAQELAEGTYAHEFDYYFSKYPNNILLVWILSRLTVLTGWKAVRIGAFFQCLLAVGALGLVYLCARKLFPKSCTCAWLAVVWTLFLSGYSPWFMIAYSDGMAYILPVLILFLYLKTQSTSRIQNFLCALLAGIAALIAFKIKPQSSILFLAVILIQIVNLFSKKKAVIQKSVFVICFSLAGFLGASALYSNVILPSLPIEIAENRNMGMAHFLMMGLNRETRGAYSQEDADYSSSFETDEARTAADLNQSAERIQNMGLSGLADHIVQKTRLNFGDGTFAWFQEGSFMDRDEESSQNGFSHFIRQFIVRDNAGFKIYVTFQQVIWLGVLIGIMGLWLLNASWKTADRPLGVMMLALSGLIIFELLFEARSRYLFTCAPVFALLMAGSCCNFRELAKKKKNRNRRSSSKH